MSLDLTYKGSNTCNTTDTDWIKTINEYVYDDFFTLSRNNFEDPWTNGFKILDEAPIKVKDDGSADFCFNTGIYKYEELMDLDDSNPAIAFLKKEIKKQPQTKYIFIQIF